jgi:hypothetical protein
MLLSLKIIWMKREILFFLRLPCGQAQEGERDTHFSYIYSFSVLYKFFCEVMGISEWEGKPMGEKKDRICNCVLQCYEVSHADYVFFPDPA